VQKESLVVEGGEVVEVVELIVVVSDEVSKLVSLLVVVSDEIPELVSLLLVVVDETSELVSLLVVVVDETSELVGALIVIVVIDVSESESEGTGQERSGRSSCRFTLEEAAPQPPRELLGCLFPAKRSVRTWKRVSE
jgi:hypothetical protein